MKAVFRRIYLTAEQGSTTSVAASVMDFDTDVTYLQPYWLPSKPRNKNNNRNSSNSSSKKSCPFPMLEMLGPYVGYQATEPRLPEDRGIKASASLFVVCEELAGCKFPTALLEPTKAA